MLYTSNSLAELNQKAVKTLISQSKFASEKRIVSHLSIIKPVSFYERRLGKNIKTVIANKSKKARYLEVVSIRRGSFLTTSTFALSGKKIITHRLVYYRNLVLHKQLCPF